MHDDSQNTSEDQAADKDFPDLGPVLSKYVRAAVREAVDKELKAITGDEITRRLRWAAEGEIKRCLDKELKDVVYKAFEKEAQRFMESIDVQTTIQNMIRQVIERRMIQHVEQGLRDYYMERCGRGTALSTVCAPGEGMNVPK
jgi:hypothetical protein